MGNKVQALLGRGEVRDGFDIEFLLRRGVPLPALSPEETKALRALVSNFTTRDFKVKLGSIVDPDTRRYYAANRFSFLAEKLQSP
jgi:hypothetical protein